MIAIGERGLGAVGGVDYYGFAVAGSEMGGNCPSIFATCQIDRNSRVIECRHVNRSQIRRHSIGKAEERIAGDAVDVGRLGSTAAITQNHVDSVGFYCGMQPSHAAHNHTVGFIELPTGERRSDSVTLIIKGEQIRPVAAIILHINPDFAVIGAAVQYIVTRHNAVSTHLAVSKHAHLERRCLVE